MKNSTFYSIIFLFMTHPPHKNHYPHFSFHVQPTNPSLYFFHDLFFHFPILFSIYPILTFFLMVPLLYLFIYSIAFLFALHPSPFHLFPLFPTFLHSSNSPSLYFSIFPPPFLHRPIWCAMFLPTTTWECNTTWWCRCLCTLEVAPVNQFPSRTLLVSGRLQYMAERIR